MVIWDNGQPHRLRLVRAVLEKHSRLGVHWPPGYSPELNTEAWVWTDLKSHKVANFAPHDLKELRRGVRLAVVWTRDRPKPLRTLARSSKLPC